MIVVLIGISCAGKSSIENALIGNKFIDINNVKITSTRDIRGDDIGGFKSVTNKEFLLMRETFDYSFLSSENTWYGYTINRTHDASIVSFIQADTAKEFINSVDDECTVFLLSADDDELHNCFKERGWSDETIKLRLEASVNNEKDLSYIAVNRENAVNIIKKHVVFG